MRKIKYIIWGLLCVVQSMYGQVFTLDDVLEDVYNQLEEEGEMEALEDVQEELMDIAANPINLNHTNADELSRLRFLSDEQIDAILLYQYEHDCRWCRDDG